MQNIFAEYAKIVIILHTKIGGIFSKKRRMSARLGKGEHNLLFEKKLGWMTLKNDQPIFDKSNEQSQIYLSFAMI